MEISGNNKKIVVHLIEYLEYILSIFLIFTCNTLFSVGELSGQGFNELSKYAPSVILFTIIVFLYLVDSKTVLDSIKKAYIPVTVLILFCMYLLITKSNMSQLDREDYVIKMLVFFSLASIYIAIKKSNNDVCSVFLKYADIVYYIALFSIVIYMVLLISPDNLYSDVSISSWTGSERPYVGIGGLFSFVGGTTFKVGDISYIKNIGICPEPPMYYIALNTGLYSELFLRGNRKSVVRGIIISLAIISTGGTNGLVMMIIAWGCFIVSQIKKNKLIFSIAIVGIVAIGGILLISHKKDIGKGSYDIHVEDYKVALECFMDNPILGAGYNNSAAIVEYMPENRQKGNDGLSNSIAVVLAECGIIVGGIFIVAYLLGVLQLFSRRRKNIGYFSLGMLAVYVTVIIIYNYILVFTIAFLISLVDVELIKKEKKLAPKVHIFGSEDNTEKTQVEESGAKSHLVDYIDIIFAALLVIILSVSKQVCLAFHEFYLSHGLYLSQSVCRIPAYISMIIFVVMAIKHEHSIFASKSSAGKIETRIMDIICTAWPSLLSIVIFELTYGLIISGIERILGSLRILNDATESIAILVVFILFLIFFTVVKRINTLLFVMEGDNSLIKVRIGSDVKRIIKENQQKFVVMFGTLAFLILVCVFGTGRKEQELVYLDDIENLNELMHEAEFSFDFTEAGFRNNEVLCTIRIYGLDDKSLLSITRITGRDVDENGHCDINVIYTNGSAGTNVYYDVIPEDGISFSIKAGSKYDELKELRISRYNYMNLPTYQMYFNPDGTPRVNKQGHSIVESDYDRQGKVIAYRYYDASGNRILYDGKYFEVKYERDGRGNATREAYYDTEENPMIQKGGYAIVEKDYDSRDFVIAIRYYDADMNPVLVDNVYHEIKYELNNEQLCTNTSYYGTDGERVVIKDGYSYLEKDYDEFDNNTEIRFYDVDGNLTESKSDYAKVDYKYNGMKKVIEERYFDTDNNLTRCKSGYAFVNRDYDDEDRLVFEQFGDDDGETILNATSYEFNREGTLFRKKFLKTDDSGELNLYMNNGEYAYYEYYYDKNGRLIREESYDTNGELTNNSKNYAVIQYEYDETTGRKVRTTFYDSNRSPVYYDGQYCTITYGYDSYGNVSEEKYFGFDNKPAVVEQGYHRMEKTYDEYKNVIDIKYYGIYGSRVNINSGFSEIKYQYNSSNRIIDEKYYDRNGNVKTIPAGFAEKCLEYDDNGNVTREYYKGSDGSPALCWDEYTEVKSYYNDENKLIKRAYIKDGNEILLGKGYSSISYSYDEQGNQNEVLFIDSFGKPVMSSDGYAIEKLEYNEKKQVVYRRYFDDNTKPVLMSRGYAEIRYEYDDLGRCIGQSYYNENGEKMVLSSGVHSEEYSYDKIGYGASVFKYFGIDGKPVLVNGEYSEIKRYYNNKKKIFKDEYYGLDGQLVNRNSGQAYFEQAWDDRGNVIQISYYDKDGNPVNINGQYFVEARAYNDDNQMINTVYYTVDGEVYDPEQ